MKARGRVLVKDLKTSCVKYAKIQTKNFFTGLKYFFSKVASIATLCCPYAVHLLGSFLFISPAF